MIKLQTRGHIQILSLDLHFPFLLTSRSQNFVFEPMAADTRDRHYVLRLMYLQALPIIVFVTVFVIVFVIIFVIVFCTFVFDPMR